MFIEARGRSILFKKETYLFESLIKISKMKVSSILSHILPHPGSGSDRTIASERQITVLAMLHFGRLATCRIGFSFTSPKNKMNKAGTHDKSNSDIYIFLFI